MPSLIDIRRRVRAVKSTQQITKAMKMVSSSKLRRAQMAAEAARLIGPHQQYGAWIHEQHHAAKTDAPSGTALLLQGVMTGVGFDRPIDMASTRAGMIPGTHTIGFDGPSDTIELTHRARDRRGFASGALLAARWIQGREGWYSMADVLKRP